MNVGLILFISSLLAGSPDEKPASQDIDYCLIDLISEAFYKPTDTNKVLYFKGRKYKPLDI